MAKAKQSNKRRCQVCRAGFSTQEPYERMCAAHRPRKFQGEEDNGVQSPGSSVTVWVPRAKVKLADTVQQWLFAHDAENECKHGALPHDKKLPRGCKCWGERQEFEKPAPATKRSAKAA